MTSALGAGVSLYNFSQIYMDPVKKTTEKNGKMYKDLNILQGNRRASMPAVGLF